MVDIVRSVPNEIHLIEAPEFDKTINVMPVPVEGPQGPIGPEGPAGPIGPEGRPGFDGTFDGTAWWSGNGEPDFIIGAKPGDKYIDVNTGAVYTLGD